MPKKIKPTRSLIWLLALPLIIVLFVLISNAVVPKKAADNSKPPAQKQALKKLEAKPKKTVKKSSKPKANEAIKKSKIKTAEPSSNQVAVKTKTSSSKSSSKTSSSSKNSKQIINPKIKVSLVVDKGSSSKTYPTDVKEGETVFDVLKTASSKYGFSLKYTNYSYGVFIEEIDSLANNPANSMYWLYYMNGKLASLGASAQKVKEGDDILWKYEKTN